jgi:hypothetical protein
MRRQIGLAHPLQPRVLVRRENAVGLALPGEDFIAFENDLFLEGLEVDAVAGQPFCDSAVAFGRRRLVVAVGVDGLNPESGGHRRNLGHGAAVQDEQIPAAATQGVFQLAHAFPDELDATVGLVVEAVENVGIEHEGAVHLPRLHQRMG